MYLNMSTLICVILFLTCCTFENTKENQNNKDITDVPSFNGKIMNSSDNGKSWQTVDQTFSNSSSFQAVGFDNENIMVAINKDSLYMTAKSQSKDWVRKTVDELTIHQPNSKNTAVSSIWSGTKNNYLEVVFGNLYKKDINSATWVPVNKPKDIINISQITEDQAGNVLLACSYGLYLSQDGCKNWIQLLTGRTDDVEILGNEIFVSTLRGVLSSKDLGKTWTSHNIPGSEMAINDNAVAFYTLSVHGDELIAIKNQDKTYLGQSIQISSYSSTNSVWKIHPANSYMKKVPNLTGFAKINNSLFCSYGEGLIVSEDNGVSWKKVLNYVSSSKNTALKVAVNNGVLYCYEIAAGC